MRHGKQRKCGRYEGEKKQLIVRKGIIKIRMEIVEAENKKIIEYIKETKSWLFKTSTN